MKKTAFFIGIGLCLTQLSYPQNHLSVRIDRPVYFILEYAEIRGLIPHLPRAKPYAASNVTGYLGAILNGAGKLLPQEQEIIGGFCDSFKQDKTGFSRGNIAGVGVLGLCAIGIDELSVFRCNLNKPEAWHMHHALAFYLRGDIGDSLSYNGAFGATFDKVAPEAFLPYTFTKEWDGFHIGFGEPRYSADGIEPVPYFSFLLENEITAILFDHALSIRLARLRRNWGAGEGSLFLSETARPFEALEFHARPLPWFHYSYLIGSLGNWRADQGLKEDSGNPTYQKMVTIEMLQFNPFTSFSVFAASIALWGKRFEPGYCAPLLYPLIHQNLNGDFDNVFLSIEAVYTFPGIAQVYLSLFIDEMELSHIEELFSNPRNAFAFQAGIRVPLPFIPFSLLCMQYTKIEPFVYAHYPEVNPASPETNVDLSYTHDGENIGFPLPPNSDSFLLMLETMPFSGLLVSFGYRLIRHGTNDYSGAYVPAIYGDIDEYFHYDIASQYPKKRFLQDGLYEWINIVTLRASYSLKNLPVCFEVFYGFSYTFEDENKSGMTPRDDETRNIVGFSVSIFR
ncbi:MAG: hypothetical protein JW881_12320 [Spirochaetales bacterium]|nr:hypothetical protein [Spirochaetales bacterium]